mgnify:CR=1 FL=1
MNNNNNLVLEILNNINNIYRDLETEYFYYVNEINNNKVNLTGINGSNLTLDLNNLFIKIILIMELFYFYLILYVHQVNF